MSLTRVTLIFLSAAIALLLALAMPACAFHGGGHAISGGGIGHGLASAGAGSGVGFTRPGWHGGGIYHGLTPDPDWRPGWDTYRQGWQGSYTYTGGLPQWGGYGEGYFSDCYTQCMYQGYGSTYCSQICPV